MALAVTDVLGLRSLSVELLIPLPQHTILWCDNISVNALASNPILHACTKHIDSDTHFLHEKVVANVIAPRYVPTESQVANILTKSLTLDRFWILYFKQNMVIPPEFSMRRNVKKHNK